MDVNKYKTFFNRGEYRGSSEENAIETVRALHRTVVALRAELERVKGMDPPQSEPPPPTEGGQENNADNNPDSNPDSDGSVLDYTLKVTEEVEEVDDDSTTVDDIELIFTTDDTKDLPECMETLVSISDGEEGEEEENKENKGRPVLLKYQQVRFDTDDTRPILASNNMPKRESGAQTLITAIPKQWKSENYLAHRFTPASPSSTNFTALPSKFSLPSTQRRAAPPPTAKPRALLSDLNFTSMVPEFTRSADRLNGSNSQSNANRRGANRRVVPDTVDGYRGDRDGASGMRRWHHARVPDNSAICTARHHWWSSVPSSPEHSSTEQFQTPPALRQSWSSLPVSPAQKGRKKGRKGKQRVAFAVRPSGSLPNLAAPDGENSGGSTDSLIDEAEEFVRSSIDMLLTHEDWETIVRRRKLRRRSEPDFVRGVPVPLSRPFLPRASTDLKLYDYVKVIHVGGRVGVGRVRYSGHPPGKLEPYVGVELETSSGDCDGHFEGNRYFECDSGRGVFVPFKKVILAWAVR